MVLVRTVLAYLAILVSTLVLAIPILLAMLFGIRFRPGGFGDLAGRRFSRWVLAAAGVKLRINNPEHIEHGDARVYVSNHVSWFDVFALAAVVPRFRFIAKKELRKIPLFGPAAGRVAAIYVDRKNQRAAFDAYRDAASEMKDGVSVVVCPEGTRGRSYALRPFKKGPFVLAIAAQAPIVPCIVHGTMAVQPKGAIMIRPGEAEITFLDPVPTAGLGYEDRDQLVRTVWMRMAEALERYGVVSDASVIDTRSPVA
ncbi:MAG TPA: lysophospholipid acyltransferase family protein [Gemmatimonadaceae bacterium]|nr:lysophospholipid acyltransferase family protein [Gemmatimonadaceae bacterium]